jgi:hypothetical protein
MMSVFLILLLVLGGLLLLAALSWGGFLLLVQLGVIVHEAGKPMHLDSANYSLKQGREVGRDEEQQP